MAEAHEQAQWHRMADLMALIANCHRTESRKPFRSEQFNPMIAAGRPHMPRGDISELKGFLPSSARVRKLKVTGDGG